MYNWNTSVDGWDKKSPSYQIWKLEQMINFGLNNKKLDVRLTRKYWSKLDLDPFRKKFMELILWPKKS